MEERAVKRRDDAPEIGDIRQLNASETSELFPPLSEEYESVLISGAARVNGRALTECVGQCCKKTWCGICKWVSKTYLLTNWSRVFK